jgi:glycosyltransferase involved in cell wall biosynthesis
MQSGTPVIATCFGGAGEAVVNGVTGFVINPFNIDVFYDSVRRVLDSDQLSSSMSVESKERFESFFTIDKCIDQYVKFILS